MAALKNKFSVDSIFNLFAVGIGGILYILVNAIIIHQFGEDVLGVFNLTYAIYIVVSQLSVFGVHLSVQMWIPRLKNDSKSIDIAMSSSLLLTVFISAIIVSFAYLCITPLVNFFSSPDLEDGLFYSLFGILFFSMNKVLLAYIMGIRKMKSFAFFTLLRFVLMFCLLLFVVFVLQEPKKVTAIVSVTELILFFFLIKFGLSNFRISISKRVFDFMKAHFNFGRKAFLGNLLLDINTRVDVIMLGYLMTDSEVGIYGFVIAVSEGVLQIPVVFRNNINPIITKASVMNNVSKKLSQILSKYIRSFYKIIGSLALLTVLLYPLGLLILGINQFFMMYWYLYSILIIGIVMAAGYLPFSMLFNQLNKPKLQSRFFFYIFLTNVIANYFFIQLLGIYGAAVGTSIASCMTVFYMRFMAKRQCNLSI